MANHVSPCIRRARRAGISCALLSGVLALLLSACSTQDVIDAIFDNPPPRPGPEKTKGEILLFDKDQHGEWYSERKYSKEQQEQAYRANRRSKDD